MPTPPAVTLGHASAAGNKRLGFFGLRRVSGRKAGAGVNMRDALAHPHKLIILNLNVERALVPVMRPFPRGWPPWYVAWRPCVLPGSDVGIVHSTLYVETPAEASAASRRQPTVITTVISLFKRHDYPLIEDFRQSQFSNAYAQASSWLFQSVVMICCHMQPNFRLLAP